MSFFGFKSKNKQPQPGGVLPPVARNITSSDGTSFNYGSISSTREIQNPSRTGAGSAMGNTSNMIARGVTPDHMGLQQQVSSFTHSLNPQYSDLVYSKCEIRQVLHKGRRPTCLSIPGRSGRLTFPTQATILFPDMAQPPIPSRLPKVKCI